MKSIVIKLLVLTVLPLMVSLPGCSSSSTGPEPTPTPEPSDDIPAYYQDINGSLISHDQAWGDTTVSGPQYILPGVTLTIKEGSTVTFEYIDNTSENIGVIVGLAGDDEHFDSPQPSARIVAEGTADKPIVFTSSRKEPSSWGGVILMGRASNNVPGGVGEAEGFPEPVPEYGGAKDDDDSGILQYVRIEYTGFAIAEGSELQSLSLYSVGNGTTLDHIQAFVSSDDGVELFGGTVDIKYYFSYGADDDSFDYDQGWQGRGQFWLGVQFPNADNGLENDGCADMSDCNGGNGPTDPTVSNVTIFGASNAQDGNRGLRLREGLEGSYNNFIVANLHGAPFTLEGGDQGEEADKTYTNYGGSLNLNKFIIHMNGAFEDKSGAGGVATESDSARYASSYTMTDPMFSDAPAYGQTTQDDIIAHHDFTLQSSSPAMSGAAAVPNDDFFDQVDFIGAMGSNDWTSEGSWVRWQ